MLMFPNFEMQMVNIIRAHPNHEVIIGVDTLGKEDLLLHISRELQTKVVASFSHYTKHRRCMSFEK
jgi:hypothetical protein